MSASWLKNSLLGAVLLGLIALGVSAPQLCSRHLPLRWIEINGDFQRLSAEQIRSSVAPLLRNGFFAADLGVVKKRVEAMPWVASVEVRKTWPDKIEIKVTEQIPLARLPDGSLLSRSGVRFSAPGASAMQGLPELSGPESRMSEVSERYLSFGRVLIATGLNIERLNLSPSGSWSLGLTGAIEIKLGREDLDARLKRFAASYARLGVTEARRPQRVDLRYANGFAVQWRSSTVEPDAIEAFILDQTST